MLNLTEYPIMTKIHLGSAASPVDNVDDPLHDETIAGDEHIRQITGGPQASTMSIENPEVFGQMFSIAPAERQCLL